MRFHEKKFAEEYERRLTSEGYPGILLEAVEKELEGVKSLIDVGAGSGFFTVPLARKGYRVIAIEPSNEMAGILENKLKKETAETASRVEIHREEWGSWQGPKEDALLCIHSIYPMRQIEEAVLKMLDYAEKRIFLVKREIAQETLSERIREHFSKKKNAFNFSEFIREILQKKGVKFDIKNLRQDREHIFYDLQKETDFFCYYLKLENAHSAAVKKFLEEVTDKREDYYTFTSVYNDQMILF
ncbi:MAG: methyltransferase domain-containing protein [bacterium]|nr:methyltransferase domain-containing protein [bacterium]